MTTHAAQKILLWWQGIRRGNECYACVSAVVAGKKMRRHTRVLVIATILMLRHAGGDADRAIADDDRGEDARLRPTVFVVLLVRNKAHTLPNMLTYLQRLHYPKDRMSLFIRSDHNQDRTAEILQTWLRNIRSEYHSVNDKIDALQHPADAAATSWTASRFRRLMELKEGALAEARKAWADFVWFLDADVFISNPDMLTQLVSAGDHTVLGPMLKSLENYSNFWGGMDEWYYYRRTDEYFQILDRKETGCFAVPMLHSSVFINLRKSDSRHLSFLPEKIRNYGGPTDDIIAFAVSALVNSVPVSVCNDQEYGYVMKPLNEEQALEDDFENLANLQLQMIADVGPPPVEHHLRSFQVPFPKKDRLGVDRVYMINLKRRPDRKAKMDSCFDILGIQYQLIDAVDGSAMTESYLKENQIRMLSDYADPYHKRPLTFGEIGCFMSHYKIWQDVLSKGHDVVIILEDDIRFEPDFREKLQRIFDDVDRLGLDWHLIYLGRKILENTSEPYVDGSNTLVHVDYAYWTLGYVLNSKGAKVLVEEEPLSKLLPVDEYLPIMYDKHPNASWKQHFHKRVLKAYSAAPRLLYPTHYTGEEGYISDTEATGTIKVPSKEEL